MTMFGKVISILILSSAGLQAQKIDEKTQAALSEQLFSALNNNNLVYAQTLVNRGADPSLGWAGQSHLLRAVEKKKLDHVKFLFKNGAKISTADPLGVGIFQSIYNHQAELLRILVDNGADINAVNDQHMSPLYLAYGEGDTSCVNLLLNRKADVNQTNGIHQQTLMFDALEKNDTALAMRLLKSGFDVEVKISDDGTTAMEKAVEKNQGMIVRKLLDLNANVNQKSMFGSPLAAACKAGNYELAKLLIERGADVHKTDWRKVSLLHNAAAGGDAQIIRLLVASGLEVDVRATNNETPLEIAAEKGQADAVRALIELKADVNAKDGDDSSPLSVAARGGSTEIIRMLLAHGASVDAKTFFNAVDEGRLEAAKMLAEAGADVGQIVNSKSPLQAASNRGDLEMAKWLIEKGAPIDRQQGTYRSPMHEAAKEGHLNIIELLIAKGADVNVKAHNGVTPLHDAAKIGSLEIMKLLLDHGADPNAQDSVTHQTPMGFAYNLSPSKKYDDVVKLLQSYGGTKSGK